MKTFEFSYEMVIAFENYVDNHSFALKFKPHYNRRQRYQKLNYIIEPFCNCWESQDAFGNTVVSGFLRQPHKFFKVLQIGTVEINSDVHEEDIPLYIYKYPSEMTKPDQKMTGLLQDIESHVYIADTLRAVSSMINEHMTYVKETTHIHTTAAEAFTEGVGVCQDYAHIMLALLRSMGMMARYVAGIMTGEGETHAWIEVYDGTVWIGYDPTNSQFIDEHYLKFSHGRDSMDCMVNRGIFSGYVPQDMSIRTSMTEIIL
ncbi:MAG: transglutaminase-like domain-containing protein [Lachnospiraceae bacterium]